MDGKHRYAIPVDFSDIAQLTIFRCEGVQDALDRAAVKYKLEQDKADDGVILALVSERELTSEELSDIDKMLQEGWLNYLATK
jgi:hypothetical protein